MTGFCCTDHFVPSGCLALQEAAIFLQEGFENDSFASHPRDDSSRQAYRFVHSPAFHILDVFAAILLMALALVEEPAVDKLQMPLQVSVEHAHIVAWWCVAGLWPAESCMPHMLGYSEMPRLVICSWSCLALLSRNLN